MSCTGCQRARRNLSRAVKSVAKGNFKQAAVQSKQFAKNVRAGIIHRQLNKKP